MQSILSPFQQTVRRYALAEGGNQTGIPLVTAWRFTRETIQMPQTDHPYLYLVLDGVLRLHTPSGILDYVAGQCSISKIDTPLAGTVLLFSSQHDFLALSVEFSTAEVITAVLNLDDSLTERSWQNRWRNRPWRQTAQLFKPFISCSPPCTKRSPPKDI